MKPHQTGTDMNPTVATTAATRRQAIAAAATALLGLALGGLPAARAHGDAGHPGTRAAPPSDERFDWGRAGEPKKVTRTVEVVMSDGMRFKPDTLTVKVGDTLRIRARNRGQLLHEIVIGTRSELERHAELMKKHPGMEHDEPYMAHVSPGRRGEIVWQFDREGEFMFGCLVVGHWEAGMRGTIRVLAR